MSCRSVAIFRFLVGMARHQMVLNHASFTSYVGFNLSSVLTTDIMVCDKAVHAGSRLLNGLFNLPVFLLCVCRMCFCLSLLSSFDIDFSSCLLRNLPSFSELLPFFFVCVDGSIVVFGFVVGKTFFPALLDSNLYFKCFLLCLFLD